MRKKERREKYGTRRKKTSEKYITLDIFAECRKRKNART
jgi:hypothetical protein